MWFLIAAAWPILKLIVAIILAVYLWSLVSEDCKRSEPYRAIRSIAAY